MKIIGIYKIENILNNKVYIGSSINIRDRWYRHNKDLKNNNCCSIKLQNSYNKNGKDNFKFSIIEECSVDILLEREQYYIDLFDSYNNGYNCAPNSSNNYGFRHSEETKNKLRLVNLGKKHSEETKRKISESNKISQLGKKHSEETKNKLSNSLKGRVLSRETIDKMLESRKNRIYKPHSEETKKKISDSKIGQKYKPLSEKQKKAIGDFHRGKIVSDETRKKMSDSRKNRKIK